MVHQTYHFKTRFDERVCSKTKRSQLITEEAYRFGTTSRTASDARLKRFLRRIRNSNTGEPKAYKGQVYIFRGKHAITIYPLPYKLRSLK